MTGNEIRSKFLEFFSSKGHKIIPSDSLVPKDDPTVLFTTAGMQQFKRQFLGQLDDYTRAASSQKCLRTDDLEEVGRTAFHHTFFEMLGNFSFGDYFKKDAITWAWEFLTEVVRIPAGKLWVSVYTDDDEAADIWLNIIKIPPERLVRLGDKSNFWPANAKQNGPNGPCGPCSEIFFDYGPNPDCTSANCNPDCDCGRFSEIWNLVFTQFNRKDGGELEPLPAKNIDTGMGLERLTAVLQGKANNFDTGLFQPIIKTIEQEIERDGVTLSLTERRIIADHARAFVFAINDGIIPSNKERGAVVKRLINDSTNLVLEKGASRPSVYRLVPAVIETMRVPYPELNSKTGQISGLVRKCEEAFIQVRRERIPELEALDLKTMPAEERGRVYFRFRDTYGLPLSTIMRAASRMGLGESDITEDMKHYHRLMNEQRERSRASSKMAGDVFTDADLDLNVEKTCFLGYEQTTSDALVLKLFSHEGETQTVTKGETVKIVLDQTPFYAEAGGQVGDTGLIKSEQGTVRIHDTQKISDVILHCGTVEEGSLTTADRVTARIDEERRLAIMRNHTATHLLQAALREILGTHVQQQGSLVAEDRLRFDFTHPQAVTPEQKQAIEEYVNTRILNCDMVQKQVLPLAEAKKLGALAFFAEKYGETVRVVSVGNYSKEFCGGTHLDSTGQIGPFKITGESAIAQGIRRLEAVTGTKTLDLWKTQAGRLDEMSRLLRCPDEEIPDRIRARTKKIKDLEKECDTFRWDTIKNSIADVIDTAPSVNGVKLIIREFEQADMGLLRRASDLFKKKLPSAAVVLLGSRSGQSANLLCTVTDDLIKKAVLAREIITQIAPLIGGSGGGRDNLAQAGSKEPGRLDRAMKEARDLIQAKLETL